MQDVAQIKIKTLLWITVATLKSLLVKVKNTHQNEKTRIQQKFHAPY